jgi:hypothetical protein
VSTTQQAILAEVTKLRQRIAEAGKLPGHALTMVVVPGEAVVYVAIKRELDIEPIVVPFEMAVFLQCAGSALVSLGQPGAPPQPGLQVPPGANGDGPIRRIK